MNAKDLTEIKQIITEEIVRMKESILHYKALTKPISPENAIGRISRMDAINNKSINEEALRQAELKLNNLNIALSNINDPEFGLCAKCHAQIPIGRIMLMPHSRFCVRCAR